MERKFDFDSLLSSVVFTLLRSLVKFCYWKKCKLLLKFYFTIKQWCWHSPRIAIIAFPYYWYIHTCICIGKQSYKYLSRIPLPTESIIRNSNYSSESHSISVYVVVATDRWPLWKFHHSLRGTNKSSERRRAFVLILMKQRWLVRLAVSTSVVLSALSS